ncbi:MAG: radical SAM/SPASM domain-containing protein [Chloroflexota bacterium]
MVSVISGLFKSAQKQLTEWKVEPYLHFEPHRVYNPLKDREIPFDDLFFGTARAFLNGETSFKTLPTLLQERLISDEWVIRPDTATDDRFLIKFVSLEANVACNQSCYFCPVSVTRRTDNVMSLELYENIVQQLTAYKDTLQVVFMNHYNEPTVDKFFVDRVRILKKHGLQPALLTNGSGLTPRRIDALVEMGGVRFLSVNLSTIDRERYVKERGQDQMEMILRNLEYAKDKRLADDMGVIVLGMSDENHERDYQEISARFAGTNFKVTKYQVDSRSQFFDFGDMPMEPIKHLRGCEQTGSRPLQHLHVTGEAKAILCCQDYHSEYVVGDLNTQTVDEVLKGAAMGLMRRWVYGLEEAPEDFICRRCTFALAR